uniref:Uncharacterized protein n=1 Tax=Anguilla anguilla TaxID=7936 RepID=A0A0E9TKM4_ANGAN
MPASVPPSRFPVANLSVRNSLFQDQMKS